MKGHTNILALRQTAEKLFCRIDSPGQRGRPGVTRSDTGQPAQQTLLWRPSHRNVHRQATRNQQANTQT